MNPPEDLQPAVAPLDYASPRPSSPMVAIGALVLCCLFWGYSFPVMQIATAAFDRHVLPAQPGESLQLASRALFNGLRFGLAALLYAAVAGRHFKSFNRAEIVGGSVIGALFGGAMLLQVIGLRWVVPSVSGFFTALPVVFAPLAQAAFFKRQVGGRTWLAVALAVVGIVLLSWPKPEAAAANTLAIAPPVPFLGELCTIAAALVFTAEIIAVHHFGQSGDPVRITFMMLVSTSVLSLLAGTIIAGSFPLRASTLAHLACDRQVVWTLGTLIAISSVLALHLMNTFQPRVSPAIASVVYCTEPLFATLFSLAFATEKLTRLTVAGGAVVIASVWIVARATSPHAGLGAPSDDPDSSPNS